MVRYRVHWVILRWPIAPCCCHSWSFGMTTVRICMMIELVMYGMIPSAKRLNWVSACPEKSCRNASTPPSRACSPIDRTAFWSTPGTGR